MTSWQFQCSACAASGFSVNPPTGCAEFEIGLDSSFAGKKNVGAILSISMRYSSRSHSCRLYFKRSANVDARSSTHCRTRGIHLAQCVNTRKRNAASPEQRCSQAGRCATEAVGPTAGIPRLPRCHTGSAHDGAGEFRIETTVSAVVCLIKHSSRPELAACSTPAGEVLRE
jgi:hypothetical protein